MAWLFPSVVATLVGTLFLAGTYFYLYHWDRKRFLLVWTIGWLAYSLRFLFQLLALTPLFSTLGPALELLYLLATLASGLLLYHGTNLFIGRSPPRGGLLATACVAIWTVAAALLGIGFFWKTLPLFFFVGAIYIWTGAVFLRRPLAQGGSANTLVGWAFILWGLHKIDYPFLRPVSWFAPWGYLLATCFSLSVAIGLLLIYFRATRNELARSEKLLRQLTDAIPQVFWVGSPDWQQVFYVSPAYELIWGRSRASLYEAPRSWLEAVLEEDRAATREAIPASITGDCQLIQFPEYRILRPDSSLRLIRTRAFPIRNESGKVVRIAGISEDITRQRESEEKLYFAQSAIDRSSDAIFWITADARIVYANQAACAWLGYSSEELVALSVPDVDQLYDAERWRNHWQELKNRGSLTLETRHRTKDGREFPVEVAANHLSFGGHEYNCAFVRDISERKTAEREKVKLEEQLRQARKMEALGTLSGGIAHDFNNILAAIFGFSDLALLKLGASSPARQDVEEILTAARRARDLVRQILLFTRKSEQDRRPVDLVPLVAETAKLLRASAPATVHFKIHLDPEPGLVLGDASQLQQVILNLCTNALQAMEESGGELEVEVRAVAFGDQEAAGKAGGQPGRYVRLSVRDSGHGMPPAVMERIFDPYYTTRKVGKGTGMGLAVVHGIVKGHQGFLRVESKPGQGSLFEVYLPATDAQPLADGGPAADDSAPGTGERILLVDDEEAIIRFTSQLLESRGYRLTAVTDGRQALERFRAQPENFDLVITDMTMPELTGLQLARELHKTRPGLPVLLCTGYNPEVASASLNESVIRAVLQKPVSGSDLLRTVRAVLDSQAAVLSRQKQEISGKTSKRD